jgi:predicted HD superfamily hydrolase involved in NAD metabolism
VSAPSYADMDLLLGERLSEGAVTHSRAVGDTAALLAAIYGVDADLARLAGLLHDWDRELPESELLSSAEELGVGVSEADRAVPYLLHARTGAARLRSEFPGMPEAVTRAIACHTVGSADMGEIDMVVYIADMISSDRTFPGVTELREAVGNVGLDDLFAVCYQRSISHLVERRKRLHPDTVAVWNELVARGPNG